MADNESLKLALEFAKAKHKGQKRIGGDDYITHPIAVAQIVKNLGYDETYQITALFHDLLEDTDATVEDLVALGLECYEIEAVKLLTKPHKEDYMHYVSKGIELSPRIARKYSKSFCNHVDGVVAPTKKTEKLLKILPKDMAKTKR